MNVADLMTQDVVSARPEETVGEAIALLEDQLIRHLPVVGSSRLLGMVSDRDLREYRLPLADAIADPQHAKKLLATPVREAMASHVVTVTPDDDIGDVIDMMLTHDLGAMPVVDAGGNLVGVISYVDVLQWVRDGKGAQTT